MYAELTATGLDVLLEIDPRIQQIGVERNPDHAYQDPRVSRHVNDGRAFLRTTDARYDLVVDTEQYHHLSTLLVNALRPRWLCGFDTLGRRRLHTHSVAHAEDTYEIAAQAEGVADDPETIDDPVAAPSYGLSLGLAWVIGGKE